MCVYVCVCVFQFLTDSFKSLSVYLEIDCLRSTEPPQCHFLGPDNGTARHTLYMYSMCNEYSISDYSRAYL